MRKCPYCAEEIQDEAIKCKHCQSTVERSFSVPPAAPASLEQSPPPPPAPSASPAAVKPPSRVFHACLSLLTCGLWSVVWVALEVHYHNQMKAAGAPLSERDKTAAGASAIFLAVGAIVVIAGGVMNSSDNSDVAASPVQVRQPPVPAAPAPSRTLADPAPADAAAAVPAPAPAGKPPMPVEVQTYLLKVAVRMPPFQEASSAVTELSNLAGANPAVIVTQEWQLRIALATSRLKESGAALGAVEPVPQSMRELDGVLQRLGREAELCATNYIEGVARVDASLLDRAATNMRNMGALALQASQITDAIQEQYGIGQ